MRKMMAVLSVLVLLSMVVSVSWAQTPDDVHVDLTLGTTPPVVFAPGGGGSAPYEGSPDVLLDDFNRANGPLGPNWAVNAGTFAIVSQAAVGNAMAIATYVGANAPPDGSTAEGDVATVGTALQYTGVVLNYGAGSSNIFLKVQDQSGDGRFEYGACYTGNNGGGFGMGFFPLNQSFASAHMKGTYAAGAVTIEFTNVDGGTLPDQTYVCTGAPAPEGDLVGINGYSGTAWIDNFAAGPAGPNVFVTHVLIIPLPSGAPQLLLGVVRTATGDGATPVAGAIVDVNWTLPIGGGYVLPQTKTTNAKGLAFPVMLPNWPGCYVLDLLNVTAAGYVYTGNDNWDETETWCKP